MVNNRHLPGTASPPQEPHLPSSFFAPSTIGVLLFLYLRSFMIPGTPFVALGDQTLFFARAVHIVQGRVMYRDRFELVTPGTDLFYAAIFRFFGVHAWVMQASAVAVGLALFLVVTQIAGKILQGPLVLLPGVLVVVSDFNSALDMTHHWYSTLAAMSAVCVLMGGTGIGRIVAASSLCGLATLFTQTQGGLTFLGVLIYL